MNFKELKSGDWVELLEAPPNSHVDRWLDFKRSLGGRKFRVIHVTNYESNDGLDVCIDVEGFGNWWINHKAIKCIVPPLSPQEKIIMKIAIMEKRFVNRRA